MNMFRHFGELGFIVKYVFIVGFITRMFKVDRGICSNGDALRVKWLMTKSDELPNGDKLECIYAHLITSGLITSRHMSVYLARFVRKIAS